MVDEGNFIKKEGFIVNDDEFILWNVFFLKQFFPWFLGSVSECCGGIRKNKHVRLEVFSFCNFIMLLILFMEFNNDVAIWVCKEVLEKCLSEKMWGFELLDFPYVISRIEEYLKRHVDALCKKESGILKDELYSLVRDLVYDLDFRERGLNRDDLVYGLFLVSFLFSNCLRERDFVSLIKKFGGPFEYLNKAMDIFRKYDVLLGKYNEALDGFALVVKGYFLV